MARLTPSMYGWLSPFALLANHRPRHPAHTDSAPPWPLHFCLQAADCRRGPRALYGPRRSRGGEGGGNGDASAPRIRRWTTRRSHFRLCSAAMRKSGGGGGRPRGPSAHACCGIVCVGGGVLTSFQGHFSIGRRRQSALAPVTPVRHSPPLRPARPTFRQPRFTLGRAHTHCAAPSNVQTLPFVLPSPPRRPRAVCRVRLVISAAAPAGAVP